MEHTTTKKRDRDDDLSSTSSEYSDISHDNVEDDQSQSGFQEGNFSQFGLFLTENSQESLNSSSGSKSQPEKRRALQHVSARNVKAGIIRWMEGEKDKNGEKGLITKTMAQFPNEFRGSYNANHLKCSRWWHERESYLLKHNSSAKMNMGHYFKVLGGRGRKISPWVDYLHQKLLGEFNRLRKSGVKFSSSLLGDIARTLVNDNEIEMYQLFKLFKFEMLSKITTRWIQSFQNRFDIVSRAQTGKLLCSPEQENSIKRSIAKHLGQLKREFDQGILNEDLVENLDETHFVINMDNGKTLGFVGDTVVKYADVVSGAVGMTMVVRIKGGIASLIAPPMMIFPNQNRSYPIRGIPDDVPGACYRSTPSGWMDQSLFAIWFREDKAYQGDEYGRKKYLFVDNFSGHNISPEIQEELENKNTEIRYFPPNTTDKLQPADSFVISKIKDEWTRRWEAKKMELIRNNQWMNASGKLNNPGFYYFLTLAAESVKAVNDMRDSDGLSFARKAMIQCGLACNIHGTWEVSQLRQELQEIIQQFPEDFEAQAS